VGSSWIAYNELAWTEDLLADPSDYEGEAGGYVNLIRHRGDLTVHTECHVLGLFPQEAWEKVLMALQYFFTTATSLDTE
jgi:hypothetical protein